ncbi:MAG: hypothetical protein ABH871_02795 [Pseudomonadota bacterium]
MNKHARNIIYIAIIAAALCIIALFLQDTSLRIKKPAYQASASTEIKFTQLSQWIPQDAEFDITVDVPRALANPDLKFRLTEIANGRTGVAAELIDALLNNEGGIGLISVAGILGDKDTASKLMIIAQGQFDEKTMLPSIRAAMSANRAGISARDLKWSTLYYESDNRSPFGFMLLDDKHMAVGERDALEAFFLKKPEASKNIKRMSDDVLFGHIKIGKRVKDLTPKMIVMPDSLDFSSKDGIMLTAHVPCEGQLAAMNVRMFLEGVRSLMMIQQENNAPLISILDKISITSEGKIVAVTTKLAPFLNLWSSESRTNKL